MATTTAVTPDGLVERFSSTLETKRAPEVPPELVSRALSELPLQEQLGSSALQVVQPRYQLRPLDSLVIEKTLLASGLFRSLRFTPNMTDVEFLNILAMPRKQLNAWTELSLAGCKKITDISVQRIHQLGLKLAELDLSGTSVTDAVIPLLKARKVNLSDCWHITPLSHEEIPRYWKMVNCGLRPKINEMTGVVDRFWDDDCDGSIVGECLTEEIRDGYIKGEYPIGGPFSIYNYQHYFVTVEESARQPTYFSKEGLWLPQR